MGIRGKLFALTMGLIIFSLGAIITIEIRYIKDILKNYNLTNVISDSKNLNSRLDNALDLILTEHAGIFTTFLNLPGNDRN